MRLVRRLGPLAALLLLLPLAGCGKNSIDAYCSDLSSHQKQMSAMIDSTSPDALLDNLPMLHDLAAKAPEDLADEWQTFLHALDNLDEAIRATGKKPSDFSGGKAPSGVSASRFASVKAAADQVRGDDVVQASAGIEQQARDVCKINLGL